MNEWMPLEGLRKGAIFEDRAAAFPLPSGVG